MNSFIDFILSFFKANHDTGVVFDPRAEDAKQKDFLHEERVPAPTPDPFSNPKIEQSPFPYENQWRTSSCVPHGVALATSVERVLDGGEFARLAQLFVYRLRANFGSEGAWLQDIFNIIAKWGAPLFASLPTPDNATESYANGVKLTNQQYIEAEIYRGGEYYSLEEPTDFVEIARIAQQGHAVPILIYATYEEWAREYPVILNPNLQLRDAAAAVHHCIAVLPKSGFWENGKRYVTIQDSAHFGGIKKRHLSEDFIKARCYGAAYWDTVKFIGNGERPQFTFTKTLKFGANSNEVKQVQNLLIAEGLLPVDLNTGYFGGRTLAGIRAFQNKYAADILAPIGLDAPTDTWGSMCIAKANKLCTR